MRRGISKFLTGLLAMSLVFSSGSYPVYGSGNQPSVVLDLEKTKAVTGPATEVVSPTTDAVTGPAAGVGQNIGMPRGTIEVKPALEVQIVSGVEVKKAQDFQVVLRNGTKEYKEQVKLLRTDASSFEPSRAVASFSEVESGTYDLVVSGDGYITYTQRVEVKNNLSYRIQIYTGKVEIDGPGVIIRGDVNGDGKLSKEDATAVVDAIEAKNQGSNYDLNGDGVVDLLDLNYVTDFLAKYEPRTAEPEILIPTSLVTADVLSGTEIDNGSVKNILEGTGELGLSSSSGAISESNPVQLDFDFTGAKEPVNMSGIVIEPSKTGRGVICSGYIEIVYGENNETMTLPITSPAGGVLLGAVGQRSGASANVDETGTLVVSLGGQIAVKHVTLKITGIGGKDNKLNLAQMSSVEFVNDMEKRIPDPVMNVPTQLKAVAGNKSFVLSWSKEKNVTGYEVMISYNGITETRKTTSTQIDIRQFNKSELENNIAYTVCVQSINGEWKSGYSKSIEVTPKPNKKPDAPDNVKVRGGYRSITVSWSKLDDADTFNLFYKEDGEAEFKKVTGIKGLAYEITGLKDDTKYVVYLTATNELGEGPASLQAADKTLGAVADVKLPEYKLINTSNGSGVLSNHIKSAVIGGIGTMVDSPLDKEKSALGIFDNTCNSYVECADWDYGGAYPDAVKGVTAELDKVYTIGMIALYEPVDIGTYSFASVSYWDEKNEKHALKNVSIVQRTIDNRRFYLIKFNEPIKTSKLQVGIGRYGSSPRMVRIAEMRFYEYDSLEQDIMNLYADDLHIVLKDTVTEAVIAQLQTRLDTKDSVSGEYHPEREMLQTELDMAKKLLQTPGLNDVIQVNPNIAASNDSQIASGGLNAWQPLGVAAASEEQIVVYVGHPGMKSGANTNIQLVFTQQHAESSNLYKAVNLKIGRNEITLPKISSTDKEKGGALYVQYSGSNAKDQYAVRVSGGVKFPVLNLYGVPEADRAQRIDTYVKELAAYVAQIESQHNELHAGNQNENVNYTYDAKTCILNMTDIQMDKMMLSIPASQALAGLGTGDRATALKNAIVSMDGMLTLFYQHKGLTNSFAEGTSADVIAKNHLPYRYLNIRYMKMFAGAFMYAAGNHIGIEWGSTPGVVNCTPVSADADGRYISGRYFGWGIAHEVGHQINQSAYALAEVTNNYFSVLAQAKDTNDSVRLQYSEVFKKVTSGTWGYSSNVFTQLGMYWQLHLAYDRDYNFKTYDTYQEIIENLFFARVDSYARNASAAPAPGGVSLTLDGDRDQNLMRLASAAAQKDLTDFFTRWGLVPDAKTLAYMNQFTKETRAIYYVDDAARVYEMENGKSGAITNKDVVSATVSANGSTVTLTMRPAASSDVIQGYEITRVFTEQGKQRREVAGFTQDETFIDQVAFAANHVIAYEVTAIDKFMNRSAVCETVPVKIGGDGQKDKTNWTVTTNMTSSQDKVNDSTENDPCEPTPVPAIDKVIDGTTSTVYTGSSSGEDPYIILALNQFTDVTALRYTSSGGSGITNYVIEVSKDGTSYTEVKKGTFKSGTDTVYFENGTDPWVCTYDAAFVKLTAVGQSGKTISVAEIDLFGPSGDNIEFLSGQSGIGVLSNAYTYAAGKTIPAGSIIFTGTYKGNPAYNVVVLYDGDGNIVGGTDSDNNLVAHQIILADDPKDAMLGETSEGRWIYWIEPVSGSTPPTLSAKYVRAELYRVDNALTNEGQRLVSDTEYVEIPATLPNISLSN